MNYEQMLQRLIDGLDIIENRLGAVQIVAHGYLIAVPGGAYSGDAPYTKSDRESLEEMGWRWGDKFGWMLPVLG